MTTTPEEYKSTEQDIKFRDRYHVIGQMIIDLFRKQRADNLEQIFTLTTLLACCVVSHTDEVENIAETLESTHKLLDERVQIYKTLRTKND